jgi:hypothetical protein
MRKKKPQGSPKTTTGRVFAARFINPSVSFTVALRGHTDQKTTRRLKEVQVKRIPYPQTPNNSKQVNEFRLPV